MRRGHRSGGRTAFFLVYILLASYFVNFGLGFVTLPEFIMKIHNWIVLVGGVLIFISAFNFLKVKRHNF